MTSTPGVTATSIAATTAALEQSNGSGGWNPVEGNGEAAQQARDRAAQSGGQTRDRSGVEQQQARRVPAGMARLKAVNSKATAVRARLATTERPAVAAGRVADLRALVRAATGAAAERAGAVAGAASARFASASRGRHRGYERMQEERLARGVTSVERF